MGSVFNMLAWDTVGGSVGIPTVLSSITFLGKKPEVYVKDGGEEKEFKLVCESTRDSTIESTMEVKGK